MTKMRQRPFIFQCMVNVRSKTCTHEEHNLIIITKERQKPYIVQYTRKHGMVCVKKMWRIDSERRVIFGNDIKPKIKRNRRPKTCNYWEIVHLEGAGEGEEALATQDMRVWLKLRVMMRCSCDSSYHCLSRSLT